MDKIIVYSANVGGYDDLWTPTVYDPSIRYILFTDNKFFKSDVWEVNHIDFLNNPSFDSRLKARCIKTNPHNFLPHHDVSIWIDNCFKFKFTSAKEMLDDLNFKDHNIMCYPHEVRDCIYEEGKVVIHAGLDLAHVVREQMSKYELEGFPQKYGLFQSGFMFRKNNSQVNKFNDVWWKEILRHSGRDQLSQVYSSWKTNTPISPVNGFGTVYDNKFLEKKIKHNKRWKSI